MKLFLAPLLIFFLAGFQSQNIPPYQTNPYCGKTKADFPMPPWSCPEADEHAQQICVEVCYEQLFWRQMLRDYDKACKDWNTGYNIFMSCVNTALGTFQGCLQASITPEEMQECEAVFSTAVASCQATWDLKQAQVALDLIQHSSMNYDAFYDCVEQGCCIGIHD